MRKKYSFFTMLWIAFWAILPAALSLLVVFNLRVGKVQMSSNPGIPSGKLYYSVHDKDISLEQGRLVVIYQNGEKQVVQVAYAPGQSVSAADDESDHYEDGKQHSIINGIVQNGYFFSLEDGTLQCYPTDVIWGDAIILGS